MVSPFCLGAVGHPSVVASAFDAGINFFFLTADAHWPQDEHLRRGLEQLFARGSGIRDRVVVAAASYAVQPTFRHSPFVDVIDHVRGLDRLDVLVAGGVHGDDFARRFKAYEQHRQNAYLGARAVGASFHEPAALAPHAVRGDLDVGFIRHNPILSGARKDLFPRVAERRSRIFGFDSLLGAIGNERLEQLGLEPDHWRPKPRDYHRFALSAPEVDGVLFEAKDSAHVEELAHALEEGPLDDEEQQYLLDLALLATGRATLPSSAAEGSPALTS